MQHFSSIKVVLFCEQVMDCLHMVSEFVCKPTSEKKDAQDRLCTSMPPNAPSYENSTRSLFRDDIMSDISRHKL